MQCKICEKSAEFFSEGAILGNVIQYFRCPNCHFIQTEDPYWLAKAYNSPITSSDIGLLDRNIKLQKLGAAIIKVLFNPKRKFLDFGGGLGVYVRLMRDSGLNFLRYDKYAQNIFAEGHDVTDVAQNYELATAFEVFEHFPNPKEQVQEILKFSRNILFSTELVPDPAPKPHEWWYFAPEHGQHVSLYSEDSLRKLGKYFDLNFCTDGKSLHLFSKIKVNQFLFQNLCNPKLAFLVNKIIRLPSLLPQDFAAIRSNARH